MKYKICKLVDGNGTTTYRIKKKGWLFWRWITAASGPLGHLEYLDFFTFEQAKKWVADLQKCSEYRKKSRKIKVMECVEV